MRFLGIYPSLLKVAKVIPLYKADDPRTFSNYRPVSVLPVISKILERIMYNRLIAYLNENNILYAKQFPKITLFTIDSVTGTAKIVHHNQVSAIAIVRYVQFFS